MKHLLAFGLSLSLFCLSAHAAGLSTFTGKYVLAEAIVGNCPATTRVNIWTIDVPVIDVLNVDDFGEFSVPRHPNQGEPSERIDATHFAEAYGPSMEYDGPSCTVRVDFPHARRLHAIKVCNDGVSLECSYSRR